MNSIKEKQAQKNKSGLNKIDVQGFAKSYRRDELGFTLIELIVVIVIISILSTIGGSFMIRTIESYHETVSRSQMIQRGRQSIERITRQLRIALPNSVQVSANNLCIEWLPVVGGGNYVDELPDQDNGAAAVSSINVSPINFDIGTPRYVVVSALNTSEIYNAAPSSLALYSSINTGVIPNVITLATSKQFLRNSVNSRLFVVDHPSQFCASGGNLLYHEGYTSSANFPSSGSLTGSPPNTGTILAEGIVVAGETLFSIASGTETRNTIVTIELPVSSRGEKIVLRHQVMVRNVP